MLEEIVADFGPDHRVSTCRYTQPDDDKKPSCIVGQVFYRLDPDILRQISDCRLNSAGPDYVLESIETDFQFTRPALAVLNAAQRAQDGRIENDYDTTWGHALEVAKSA